MAQVNLKFGSLILCSPSSYKDGYIPVHQTRTIDYQHIVIPNTSGYILKAIGIGQNNDTCSKLEIEGQIQRDNLYTIQSIITQAELTQSDPDSCIADVSFSYINDSNTYTMTDTVMSFNPNKVWRDAEGKWYLNFTASFNQISF